MKLDQETEELRHKTVDMNVGKVTLNLLAGGHRTITNLDGRGRYILGGYCLNNVAFFLMGWRGYWIVL